jgi:hypothetical protein
VDPAVRADGAGEGVQAGEVAGSVADERAAHGVADAVRPLHSQCRLALLGHLGDAGEDLADGVAVERVRCGRGVGLVAVVGVLLVVEQAAGVEAVA